jgi:integrase
MKRKLIETYGPRRGGVRVVLERGMCLALYRDHAGRRRYKAFDKGTIGQASAKVWAKAYWEGRMDRQKPAVTVRALWDRYKVARFPYLRVRSRALYAERFSWWEDFMGPNASAESVSLELIESFRREQKKAGKAMNQIRAIVGTAKIVWNWGELAEIVQRNPLGRYRFEFAKGEKAAEPGAYTVDEFKRLLATLNPRSAYQWRSWCLFSVLGNQGVRAVAARHLRWADVDLAGCGILWRADYDKTGKEWWQPLLDPTRDALLVALGYGNGSEWVFPAAQRKTRKNAVYTMQALTDALHRAEDKAGIEHRDLMALHGLRRMVVNRVRRLTGDYAAALRFVGDKERQAKSYVRVENAEMSEIAGLLSTESANPAPKSHTVGV